MVEREVADWEGARAAKAGAEEKAAEAEAAKMGGNMVAGMGETEELAKVAVARAVEAAAEVRAVAARAAEIAAAEPVAVDAVTAAPAARQPEGVEVPQAVVEKERAVPPVE